MKPHRIFIAINLPDETKEQLLAYREKWPELLAPRNLGEVGPARWVDKDNLHLTLVFLGNTSDPELAGISVLMNQIGDRHKVFTLHINRLTYGPKPSNPRMIWARIEKSPELLALQQDVEKNLQQGGDNVFSPHLTLARLNAFQLRQLEEEEIPEISEDISISFEVGSIEVMESQLKRSGAEYTVCQSISLVV